MCVVAGTFIVGYHVIVDAAVVVYLMEEHGLSESFAGTISATLPLTFRFDVFVFLLGFLCCLRCVSGVVEEGSLAQHDFHPPPDDEPLRFLVLGALADTSNAQVSMLSANVFLQHVRDHHRWNGGREVFWRHRNHSICAGLLRGGSR